MADAEDDSMSSSRSHGRSKEHDRNYSRNRSISDEKRRRRRHDSSLSKEDSPLTSSTKHNEKNVKSSNTRFRFFLAAGDQELENLVVNFKRTQSNDKIVSSWQKSRKFFVKRYKKQRRDKLREKNMKIREKNNRFMDSNIPDNANLYELLGCNKSSTPEQIISEYKARVRNYHPDKVIDSEKGIASNQFRLLKAARDILSDSKKRNHYDTYLSIGSQMSLKDWMDNQEKIQQTMHWVQNKEPTPALTNPQNSNDQSKKVDSWQRHDSATLQAFRSYKI